MPLLRVQIVLHTTSALPEDYVTNTWHFDDGAGGYYEEIKTALLAFYNGVRPYYSSWFTQAGHEIKMYQISDPEPRAPVYEDSWAFAAAPSGQPLPHEVALVMSFQAPQVSGERQARRRGRIYLGSFQTTINGADGLVSAAALTALQGVADTLVTASKASSTWKWSTYSTVTNAGHEVDNGWFDNAFDTQRRRGRKATQRVTFS